LKQDDSLSTVIFNLVLQKVIQSIKMVPSVIKISKEQLSILAYADNIVLIGKNEIRNKTAFYNLYLFSVHVF